MGGVWFGGGNLSLGSLVGFVTLFGIAVRNGIMMISHFRHLEEEEGLEFGDQLAIRGAQKRLAPILMTALTAALALLPLVVAGNRPGHEIEYPMALVIVGGLLCSTLMNLFFIPSFYRAIGRVSSRLPSRPAPASFKSGKPRNCCCPWPIVPAVSTIAVVGPHR